MAVESQKGIGKLFEFVRQVILVRDGKRFSLKSTLYLLEKRSQRSTLRLDLRQILFSILGARFNDLPLLLHLLRSHLMEWPEPNSIYPLLDATVVISTTLQSLIGLLMQRMQRLERIDNMLKAILAPNRLLKKIVPNCWCLAGHRKNEKRRLLGLDLVSMQFFR